MKKKFFALVLSFCMLLSLVPANMTLAMATDETSGQTEETEIVETVDEETVDTTAEPVNGEKSEEADVADSINENAAEEAKDEIIEDGGELGDKEETPEDDKSPADEGTAHEDSANDEYKGKSVRIPAGTNVYSSVDGEGSQKSEAETTAYVAGSIIGKEDSLWFELGGEYAAAEYRFVKNEDVELVIEQPVSLETMPPMAKAPAPKGGHNMSLEPGHIRIKINVIDWDTGEKLPGVKVGVNRIGNCPGGTVNGIFTATSESDGSAYIDRTYSVGVLGGATVAFLDSIQDLNHIIYVYGPNTVYSGYGGETGIRFDMGPLSNGYSLDLTTSGKIRNCISGSHGGKVTLTVGIGGPKYDDFIFHSGMPANGSIIEYDLYVKASKVTVSFEDKNVKDWNPADYSTQTVMPGGIVSEPSKKPVNSNNADIEFLGWADKATGALFDFTNPVTSSVVLVPKWGPNPNAKGYIHLDSFLWNHDGYNGTYQTGQTNTTVNDLTYVIEYYDQAVATTSNWHVLTTVSVDENGRAEIVITPEMIQELSDFNDSIKNLPSVGGVEHRVAIDIGPSASDKGWHEENERALNYAWDLVHYDPQYLHGAGVTGVRMMYVNDETNPVYDGIRDNNRWTLGKAGDISSPIVGNVQYAYNQNHVPWLTQGMIDDGFEIYWKCYVAPSMTVNFDLDGGTGTGDYTEQMMKPINSLPEQRADFLVKNPGGTVTKAGMNFVGWYKVKADGSLETAPWDFANRIVTESMVLRAVYTDKLYEVKFVTPEDGTQDRQHKIGDTPAWAGADPVKSPSNEYAYEFVGWKETTGTHVNTEYTFHDTYDFDHQSRTIYKDGATTPETIDSTFADLTVYTAQFNATPIDYTLSYDLNGGSGTFADQSYTVETGVTIHNAEPTKTGYKFTGWALKTTDGNWTNKSYSKNETVNGKYGNTTLIAQYAPLYNYKLNFNKNTTDPVSNMPENIPETGWIEDSTKTMSWTKEPTRTDYTFLGWATSENGSVIIPAGTKSYQMTGTAATLKEETLYALWQVNEARYVVKYLEEDTEAVLHTEKSDVAKVGANVTEYAESITGYTLVSLDPQTLVISPDETKNVIIFYYKELQAEIKYIPVPTEGGTVSVSTESVKVLNGEPTGSTASANPGYKFVGWFSDEACTKKISDNAKYVPSKNEMSGLYEAATYYAKFEEELGNLTINKSGCSSADANQSFIFHVTSTNLENTSHEAVDMYVTIQGNGSVTITDLPIGSYKVEEVSSWSWRYTSDGAKNVTVDTDGESTTIANTRTNSSWLSGSAYAINTAEGKKSK